MKFQMIFIDLDDVSLVSYSWVQPVIIQGLCQVSYSDTYWLSFSHDPELLGLKFKLPALYLQG